MSHSPKHFDEITTLFSASCPFGKLSVRQNVCSAKRLFGETSVRQNDHWQNVRSAKCPFCKMSVQHNVFWHFMDHAVELVKRENKLVFVLDNIDWTVKVHDMRADNQNRSVHAVASSLVFDCVPQS
jgi:hypothetical protein